MRFLPSRDHSHDHVHLHDPGAGAEGSLLSGSQGGQKTMGGTMMEDDLFSKKNVLVKVSL